MVAINIGNPIELFLELIFVEVTVYILGFGNIVLDSVLCRCL